MRAWAWGERTMQPCTMPGRVASSPKDPCPVSRRTSSRRLTGWLIPNFPIGSPVCSAIVVVLIAWYGSPRQRPRSAAQCVELVSVPGRIDGDVDEGWAVAGKRFGEYGCQRPVGADVPGAAPQSPRRRCHVDARVAHAPALQAPFALLDVDQGKGGVVEDDAASMVRVLEFRESRGWEVRYPFFTDQYNDARLDARDQIDRRIDGITGATLSVNAVTRVVRLALFLYRYAGEASG